MTVPYLARAVAQQRIAWIGGSVHRVVLDATATGGELAMFRSSMRGGSASPVHVHEHEDETVFVLQGSGVFWAGAERWEVESGDTAFLPRGLPHTYALTSDIVELVTICNPAGMEKFFRAAGWDLAHPPPPDWSVDLEVMRSAAEKCGQRLLGPPLAVEDQMPDAYLT